MFGALVISFFHLFTYSFDHSITNLLNSCFVPSLTMQSLKLVHGLIVMVLAHNKRCLIIGQLVLIDILTVKVHAYYYVTSLVAVQNSRCSTTELHAHPFEFFFITLSGLTKKLLVLLPQPLE